MVLAAFLPSIASAQWTLDGEAARVYDTNVSRAQLESDTIRDRAWTARAALGRPFALGDWDAAVRGEVRGARQDQYSGLNRAALGVGASARRKLGIGLTAPWIALDAAAFGDDYEEQLRDGAHGSAALSVGKRFDERLEAALVAAYDRRSQRKDLAVTPLSGRPFALQGRSVGLRASYAIAERFLLFGSAGVRRGDVVSSTRRNPEIFRESAAIANDPALGPDFVAYRLSGARTTSFALGLSWTLRRHWSIAGEAARDETAARGGLDYAGNLYSISVLYRD
jgi:hypothetical protein